MSFYDVGYDTYEESEHIQLAHEKVFSQDEFDKLVIQATIAVLKREKSLRKEHVSFQDILHDVVEELTMKRGFRRLKFDARFVVFGWPSIRDKTDWNHDREKQLDRLTDALDKALGRIPKRKLV